MATYTSFFNLSYPPHTYNNTLDIHLRDEHSTSGRSPISLIYIHGGGFRDPLDTSRTLSASISALFSLPQITSIASLNYRLSPHPHHDSDPSLPDDEARNVTWPTHLRDVRRAIRFLAEEQGWKGADVLIVGHSVGATMSLMLGLEKQGGVDWGDEVARAAGSSEKAEEMRKLGVNIRGVVGLQGIYDFVACRDAHPDWVDLYDAFMRGALGDGEKAWDELNLVRKSQGYKRGVKVVIVALSRQDELVEWAQGERMIGRLEELKEEAQEGGEEVEVEFVETQGKHAEIYEKGEEIPRVVTLALDLLKESKETS